jgi:hypothetical protein
METKNCKHCNKEFEVNSKNRRNLFCNSSCAGSYNNKKRAPQSEETKNKISETLKNKWAESRELFSTGDNHSKKVGNSTKGKFKKNVETIYDEMMNSCPHFVNSHVLEVMKQLGKEHCYIVTHGDARFQRDKIQRRARAPNECLRLRSCTSRSSRAIWEY